MPKCPSSLLFLQFVLQSYIQILNNNSNRGVIMTTHLLAGTLVFLLFANFFGTQVNGWYLLFGALCGLFPDPLSYILAKTATLNKWAHKHRDNLSHSIFLPVIALIILTPFNVKLASIVSLTLLTHPILDLIGMGWGVMIFYPFSDKVFKLFYKGKFLTIWTPEEVDAEAEKFGNNHWIRDIYFTIFTLDPVSLSEKASLLVTIFLIIYHW